MLLNPKKGFVIFFCLIKFSYAADQLFTEENCPRTTHYLCQGGTKCIVKAYVCNNLSDCPQQDDETDCGETSKPSNKNKSMTNRRIIADKKLCRGSSFFKCRSGDQCIASTLLCDNVSDCPDASDENDEMCDHVGASRDVKRPCDAQEFECEAKTCIAKSLICDGIADCMDGRDEDQEMCQRLNVISNIF